LSSSSSLSLTSAVVERARIAVVQRLPRYV
jgi:hypothetical protein